MTNLLTATLLALFIVGTGVWCLRAWSRGAR
jgi:predicted transporter